MSRENLCIAISLPSSVRRILANFQSASGCGRTRLNDVRVRLVQRGDVVAKRLTHGLKVAANHNNQSFRREGLSAEVVGGKVTIRQPIEVPLLPLQYRSRSHLAKRIRSLFVHNALK
jgi:uncharacterized NAD(P)/FAD-binding protein YdhS